MWCPVSEGTANLLIIAMTALCCCISYREGAASAERRLREEMERSRDRLLHTTK